MLKEPRQALPVIVGECYICHNPGLVYKAKQKIGDLVVELCYEHARLTT